MNTKSCIHDGIVRVILTKGVGLGYWFEPLWLLISGLLGVTLLQSTFAGFCPVYFLLDRTCTPE